MKPQTTDDVLDLLDAYFTSAALGAAMELRLFRLLEKEPLDAAGVGEALGIPGNRCHYWLQLLNAAGLLERESGKFVPSSTARTAILEAFSQESWALLAEEARGRYPGLRDLALHLREPGSVWEAMGLTPPMFHDEMARNPGLARRFTRMLYELHRPLAESLANTLDLSAVNRLMDLGGGSGVVSMALLRRHPHLTAVVVDIETVCEAGREIAAENSLADRMSYHPADFLRDDLPSGFDLVLECDVDVYGEGLFSKIHSALNSGGCFVIIDQLAPERGIAPPTRGHWAFHGSLKDPEFRYLTAAQIRSELARVGFRNPSERLLPPIRGSATRFTRGMVLIRANKGA